MSDEKEGSKFNIITMVIVILLSVLLATGASYFMVTKLGGFNQQNAEAEKTTKELGPTSPIGQFLVNLSDGRRFVKVNIVLEVSNEDAVKEIKKRTPQVRDSIISILRSKDYKEITSEQGTRILRTKIMNEINKHLLEGKVTNVFFTEFVIQ